MAVAVKGEDTNANKNKKKVKKTVIVTPSEIHTALCVLQGVLCYGTYVTTITSIN